MSRYDLLLQPPTRDLPFDEGAFARAMEARSLPRGPDGAWVLSLMGTGLEISAVREAGAVVAMQVRVPLSGRTEPLAAALAWALEVAGPLHLRVLDPQVNAVVTSATGGASREEFLRQARYAGEFGGLSEAFDALPPPAPPAGFSATTRVLLGLLVFFTVLAITFSVMSGAPTPPPPPPGPPARQER